jgi:glycosyltransferase involved in cell wall biosynthesis
MGWEPHVLTIKDKDIEHLDSARLTGFEDVPIYKAGVLPTPTSIWPAIKRRARGVFGSAQEMPAAGARTSGKAAGAAGKESLGRRMRRYLLSLLVLPDYQNGWIAPATLTAVLKIRGLRIDWILTSCPPYSAHLIGLAAKSLTGTRWVADFRDPWMTADPKAYGAMSALSIRIESWLERKVVEKADLVVFNVERLRDAYRRRYAHVLAEKLVHIPNGIAEADAAACLSPGDKYPTFTLSYTGALYVGRSPEPIFRAVALLIRSGKLRSEQIRIKLVGQCRSIDGVPTSSVVARYGLESVVELRDPVPHAEAAEIIRRSHLALLFAPKLAFQIPAKVYDYFSAGTRILAIADEGATADLVQQTGTGSVFRTEDIDGIAAFIHDELAAPKPAGTEHAAALRRFDARRITKDLVTHLNLSSRQGRGVEANETGRTV